MNPIHNFTEQSERLKLWCKAALADWHKAALDPRGGFAEFRRLDGTADFDHKRRIRVQFRLAYVYALAADLGWYEAAQSASDHAWNFATQKGFAGGDHISTGLDKGCAHMVDGDGTLLDPYRDSYAQAFILLAGAWRYRAFNDAPSLETANATLEFLDTNLLSPFGGWEEGLPIPKTPRRQNPHMHLFEAMLALYEATKNIAFLKQAEKIHRLFEANFYDASTNAILEHFENDWAPHGDGGPIEPGHMMEWAWLLSEYERLSGRPQTGTIKALYTSAIKFGQKGDSPFLIDSCALDGTPIAGTFRSWPQTELIKAGAVIAMSGDHSVLPDVTRAIAYMFETYFNTPHQGGWHDKLDEDGKVIEGPMQSSTFYHIICAAAEADKLRQTLA